MRYDARSIVAHICGFYGEGTGAKTTAAEGGYSLTSGRHLNSGREMHMRGSGATSSMNATPRREHLLKAQVLVSLSLGVLEIVGELAIISTVDLRVNSKLFHLKRIKVAPPLHF